MYSSQEEAEYLKYKYATYNKYSRAYAENAKAELNGLLNIHCGTGHPFKVRAQFQNCQIMFNNNGVWEPKLILWYDELSWSDIKIFPNLIKNIILKIKQTDALKERKFVSPKNQMKPFLTPMQEVTFD